jgi:hypothetical protein
MTKWNSYSCTQKYAMEVKLHAFSTLEVDRIGLNLSISTTNK